MLHPFKSRPGGVQQCWHEWSHNVCKPYLAELERKKAKEKEEKARDLQCKEDKYHAEAS